MPTKNSNFKGVSINKQLYYKVANFIEENPEYHSIADFFSEAARTRIEQLSKNKAPKLAEVA